jgi:5'-deoxynucleotidase YfbR-like HD superfamily hydrolase
MKIKKIFEVFQIPPGLQAHMYEVTGVGKYICDNWTGEEIDKHSVISTLLIHDLGNLIKIDLSPNNKIYDKELEKPIWKDVKQQMIDKYGSNAHKATVEMAKEIVNDPKIIGLIDDMDSTNLEKTSQQSWEEQICEYADMRVAINGVTSLEERLDDIYDRYKDHFEEWADEELLIKNKKFGKKIETALQKNTSKDILNIPEEKMATYLVKLADYEI